MTEIVDSDRCYFKRCKETAMNIVLYTYADDEDRVSPITYCDDHMDSVTASDWTPPELMEPAGAARQLLNDIADLLDSLQGCDTLEATHKYVDRSRDILDSYLDYANRALDLQEGTNTSGRE